MYIYVSYLYDPYHDIHIDVIYDARLSGRADLLADPAGDCAGLKESSQSFAEAAPSSRCAAEEVHHVHT